MQAVVDAVAALLSAGAFTSDQVADAAAEGGGAGAQGSSASRGQPAWALDFLATHLGDGRATAAPDTVMQVLGYLAGGPWLPGQAAPAAQLREQRFTNVVKHASTHMPGHAARLQAEDVERVRALALQAGFLRAEAMTLHQAGDYSAAVTCLLRSPSDASSAVKYIEDTLDDVEMGSPRRAGAFRTAVLQAMPQLTAADAALAAGLVLRRMPREHAAIVHAMSPQPELQLKYLKGALEVAKCSDAEVKSSASAALAALDRGEGPTSSSREGAAAVHGALMAREDTCELYVRLLCQYEPRAVLPFLQSHGSYRVSACMEWCREAGVHDAEAYLLEHFLGDYPAALRICLAHVDRCNAQLVAAVRGGAIALATGKHLRSGSLDVGALFHGGAGVASPPAAARSLRRGAEAVPREAAAAVAARQAAVDLCQRCAGDTASDLKAEDLWFPLLQCYIEQLQELRHIERELPPPPPQLSPPALGSGSAASSLLRLRSIEQPASPLALVRTGSTAIGREPGLHEQLQALHALFTSFMEVIISQMAGYIPLQAIGDRLLGQLEVQRWGECRGTLLGLLAAYNYEAGILAAAARLLCGDAARDLAAAYRSRLRGRPAAVSAAAAAAGGFPTAGSSSVGNVPPTLATGLGAEAGGGGGPEAMRRKMALLELS